MQLFKLKTTIHQFDSFSDFAKEFGLKASDLIITNKFLYEPFMASLALPCTFVMQEEYGLGEPSDEMMDRILADLRDVSYDRVIAIGGGTVIDISKLFALRGLTSALDAFDRVVPLVKDRQLVIVPTTCGTGSEVTNISIAEIKSRKTKMGLADDTILADDAVLIPELLAGLPFRFYVAASIDALIHALEAYVSPQSNVYSRMFSITAMNTIIDIFAKVAVDPEARHQYFCDMLVAANMAGIAFGNVGVGAVHALSYPLGGNYHVPHGEANYQFLTAVFRKYHHRDATGLLGSLELHLSELLGVDVSKVYDALDTLLGQLLERKSLREYGMLEQECRSFAEGVVERQQRLLRNNWVPLSVDEIEAIYRDLY